MPKLFEVDVFHVEHKWSVLEVIELDAFRIKFGCKFPFG